jgi:prevent-host-death family protein
MKTVSVRELQQNIKSVMERVERGESVQVTRRRRVVACLMPPRTPQRPSPWPDLAKRARAVLGKRTVTPPPSLQVGRDRGAW